MWSFRHSTGLFSRSIYNPAWLHDHTVVDTGVTVTPEILKELNNVLGVGRFPFCKCIFALRKVLNLMGGVYKVVSWIDYIPGIYARKLLSRMKR